MQKIAKVLDAQYCSEKKKHKYEKLHCQFQPWKFLSQTENLKYI